MTGKDDDSGLFRKHFGKEHNPKRARLVRQAIRLSSVAVGLTGVAKVVAPLGTAAGEAA